MEYLLKIQESKSLSVQQKADLSLEAKTLFQNPNWGEFGGSGAGANLLTNFSGSGNQSLKGSDR